MGGGGGSRRLDTDIAVLRTYKFGNFLIPIFRMIWKLRDKQVSVDLQYLCVK